MTNDLSGSLVAATVTMMAITSAIVLMRAAIRTNMKTFGFDDSKSSVDPLKQIT
jgi:hypothetical protein